MSSISATCGIIFLVACLMGFNALMEYESEDWEKLANQVYSFFFSLLTSTFFYIYMFITTVICHVMFISACIKKNPKEDEEEEMVMDGVYVVSENVKPLTEETSF